MATQGRSSRTKHIRDAFRSFNTTPDGQTLDQTLTQRGKSPSLPHDSHGNTPPHELQSQLASLSLTDRPYASSYNAQPHFVGGFAPLSSHGQPHRILPLPRPPSMPMPHVGYPAPQSMTMQLALLPENGSLRPPSRPQPSLAPPLLSSPTPSSSSISAPKRSKIPPPVSRAKSSSSDSAASVSSSTFKSQIQCAGMTKAGKRCTRMVKSGPNLADDKEADFPPVEKFCFQHTKEVLKQSGFYARKNGEWVKFEDWIPSYLQAETQASIRAEMEKVPSQSDVNGYIYTFEIREPSTNKTVKLKVGRTVNVTRRIDQWSKQCGSKEQVLRGFYPGIVETGEEGSLMKGKIKAGEKTPNCHRLERLIHLELADLVSTSVYLEPFWPAAQINSAAGSTSAVSVNNATKYAKSQTCPDCGNVHKEIFEFQKWGKGRNHGREWEAIVKPVIERWGRFVDIYV